MREATNRSAVAQKVFEESGIKIELIDGKKEAAIIFATYLSDFIETDRSYLFVDVGGGSTELTVFSGGHIVNSKSFKLGTVRLLQNGPDIKAKWALMKRWIKENTRGLSKMTLIGSGGNINKLFKLSGKTPGKPLSYSYIKAHYQFLKHMSYNQRIRELGLNPDRADVIIPATKIYLSGMKWSTA
jgi:exopolyphosphatase/guanosine-5'-triphosphate,3'-diphosphate pyrophosphatase